MIPKPEKIYTKCTKWSLNIPNVCKIFQMAIKYINIFKSMALQNLPKLGVMVLKINRLATLLNRRRSVKKMRLWLYLLIDAKVTKLPSFRR
jgi:peptidyl-tRNA hydrolase